MAMSSTGQQKGEGKPARSPRNANNALYGKLVHKEPAKWSARNLLDYWSLERPALDSLMDLTEHIWTGLGRPERKDSDPCMERVIAEWKKRGSPLKAAIRPRDTALKQRGLRAIYMFMKHRMRKAGRDSNTDAKACTDAVSHEKPCHVPSSFMDDDEEEATKASIMSDLTPFPSPTGPRPRPPPGFYGLVMEGTQFNDALHETESPPPQPLSGRSTPSIPRLPPRDSLSPVAMPCDDDSGPIVHSVGKDARADSLDLSHCHETIESSCADFKKVGECSGPSTGKIPPPERKMINLVEFLEWLYRHRHQLDKGLVEDYLESFNVGFVVADCDSGRALFRAFQGKLNNCRRNRTTPSLASPLVSPAGFSDDSTTGVGMAFWECLASAVYELEWAFIEQTLKAHEVGDKISPALTDCQVQLQVELSM